MVFTIREEKFWSLRIRQRKFFISSQDLPFLPANAGSWGELISVELKSTIPCPNRSGERTIGSSAFELLHFTTFLCKTSFSLEIFELKTVELDSCPSIRRLNLEDFVCQFDCFPCFSNSDCLVGIQSHRCDFLKFPKVPPAWFSLTLKKWGSGVDTCGQKWQVPRQKFSLFVGRFGNLSIFPLLWWKPYRNRITQFVSATVWVQTPPSYGVLFNLPSNVITFLRNYSNTLPKTIFIQNGF